MLIEKEKAILMVKQKTTLLLFVCALLSSTPRTLCCFCMRSAFEHNWTNAPTKRQCLRLASPRPVCLSFLPCVFFCPFLSPCYLASLTYFPCALCLGPSPKHYSYCVHPALDLVIFMPHISAIASALPFLCPLCLSFLPCPFFAPFFFSVVLRT